MTLANKLRRKRNNESASGRRKRLNAESSMERGGPATRTKARIPLRAESVRSEGRAVAVWAYGCRQVVKSKKHLLCCHRHIRRSGEILRVFKVSGLSYNIRD